MAKNWSRFDNLLDLLYIFGCGPDKESTKTTESGAEVVLYPDSTTAAASIAEEEDLLGLEYLMKVNFVERACDFMLGKKSPLCGPGEKRVEMGGSFA